MQLCFIDTETTGLYPAAGDRICEIGIIIVDSRLRVVQCFESLINPMRPISPEAFRVNRIKQSDVETAPIFSELSARLFDLAKDKIIAGHNVEYDHDFLKNEFNLSGFDYAPQALIDTKAIAMSLFSSSSYGLSALVGKFGIKVEGKHRAMADCRVTFELFGHLFGLYQKKNGGGLDDLVNRFAVEPDTSRKAVPAWLEKALANGEKIKVEYRSRSNLYTLRIIQPLRIFSTRGRLYLEAFCKFRNAKRTFLVDRIKKVDY